MKSLQKEDKSKISTNSILDDSFLSLLEYAVQKSPKVVIAKIKKDQNKILIDCEAKNFAAISEAIAELELFLHKNSKSIHWNRKMFCSPIFL